MPVRESVRDGKEAKAPDARLAPPGTPGLVLVPPPTGTQCLLLPTKKKTKTKHNSWLQKHEKNQTQTRAVLQKPTEEWRKGSGLLKAAWSGDPKGRGPAECGELPASSPHLYPWRCHATVFSTYLHEGRKKKKCLRCRMEAD